MPTRPVLIEAEQKPLRHAVDWNNKQVLKSFQNNIMWTLRGAIIFRQKLFNMNQIQLHAPKEILCFAETGTQLWKADGVADNCNEMLSCA